MNGLKRTILMTCAILSIAACSNQPGPPPLPDDRLVIRADATAAGQRVRATRADLAPTIQALVRDHGFASITIAAFDRQGIVWAESFGYTNVARRLHADLETVYNTGSTFKIVVVTAIMQLVETGALKLDAPVNDYLSYPVDDFTEQGAPLTLRHMLAHRAGLPASRPVPDWDVWSRQSPPPIDQQLQGMVATAMPGEEYDYCNACFPLYADIIENVSGLPLERYLREHILLPIGARYTEPLYPDAQMVEHLALPYEQIGGTPFPMPQKFLESWMSGDTYQLPVDMATFLRAFLNRGRVGDVSLLAAETVDAMFTPQFGGSVSLGFVSALEDGRRVLWWDGGVYGGSTVYHLEPEAGVGVYIASNSNQTTDTLHALARRARGLLARRGGIAAVDLPRTDDEKPITRTRSQLSDYTGAYGRGDTGPTLSVDILNDHLAIRNPEGKRFDLVLTTRDRGVLVGPRERVVFDRDASGSIRGLTIGGDAGVTFEKIGAGALQ